MSRLPEVHALTPRGNVFNQPVPDPSYLALLCPILLTTFHRPCDSRSRLVLIASFLPLELSSKRTGSFRYLDECCPVEILSTISPSGDHHSAHHTALSMSLKDISLPSPEHEKVLELSRRPAILIFLVPGGP